MNGYSRYKIPIYKLTILNIFILIISIGLINIQKGPFLGFMWDELTYIAGATNISDGLSYSLDRPPFLSAFISLIFTVCGTSLALAKYISPLFGLGSILAVYYLASVLYGKREALLSAILISSLPIHLFLATRLLTEVPFLIFFSLSVAFFYLATEKDKKYLVPLGITIALTFLTRYTGLILLALFFIYLLLTKNLKIVLSKYSLYGSILFLLTISPWVINNIYFLHSPLSPLIDNLEINRNITTVETISLPIVNSQVSSRSYYYLLAIPLIGSALLPFSVLSIWKMKQLGKQDILLVLMIIMILFPHFFLVGRYSIRFLIGLAPALAIFSARFFVQLEANKKRYSANLLVFLVWLINLLLGSGAIIWYANNRQMLENPQYPVYQATYQSIKTMGLTKANIVTNLEPVVIYAGNKAISVAYNADSFQQQLAYADYVLVSKNEPSWLKLSFIESIKGLKKIPLATVNDLGNDILFYRIAK